MWVCHFHIQYTFKTCLLRMVSCQLIWLWVTLLRGCLNYSYSILMQGLSQRISLNTLIWRPWNILTQKSLGYEEDKPDQYIFHKYTFSQDPFHQQFELGDKSTNFHIAVTDNGLCQVMNGNSMTSTFKPTIRMEELWTALDNRDDIQPRSISGSGKLYQDTFWLDIGDRFVYS